MTVTGHPAGRFHTTPLTPFYPRHYLLLQVGAYSLPPSRPRVVRYRPSGVTSRAEQQHQKGRSQ